MILAKPVILQSPTPFSSLSFHQQPFFIPVFSPSLRCVWSQSCELAPSICLVVWSSTVGFALCAGIHYTCTLVITCEHGSACSRVNIQWYPWSTSVLIIEHSLQVHLHVHVPPLLTTPMQPPVTMHNWCNRKPYWTFTYLAECS